MFHTSVEGQHYNLMQEWTPFIGKTTKAKERESKTHYAVAVVKKTAGCIEDQGM